MSSSKELNLTETEFVGFVFRMDLDLSLTIQASDEIICHWQEVAASPYGLLPGSPVAQSADDLGPLQREGRQGPDSGHPGHYRGQAVNLRDISEKYIVKQLEECRLQGVRKLAVNGRVSGYCVHLPVCNLQTVKSSEKVSCLREALDSL